MKGKSSIELSSILQKDLVLIVTPSNFLYIVIDSITKSFLSLTTFKSIESLKENELSFEAVSVFILNEKFTTIPSALFNDGKAKEYLEFTTSINENTLVFSEKNAVEKLIIIWSIESQLKSTITTIFSRAVFKSILTPFINRGNTTDSKNKISSLFIEDRVVISVFKNRVLQLVNIFEIKSIEDALYYHLLLFQSTELLEEEIEVITGGIYEKIDLFVKKLAIYFSNVSRIVGASDIDGSCNEQSFIEIVKSVN